MNEKTLKPCDLVIFGAVGDLSRRKLLVSLYRLEKADLITQDTRIIGIDRLPEDSSGFVAITLKSLQEFLGEEIDNTVWTKFSSRLSYLKIDLTQPDQFQQLHTVIDQKTRVMVNYFSVPPSLFKNICQGLAKSGVLTRESRIVMEKPIGHDLESSKKNQ